MTKLSVNMDKIALLRNSRDGNYFNLAEFAAKIIRFGADGLTVHPRKDKRHITLEDVIELSKLPDVVNNDIVINVESDLRKEVIDVILNNNIKQFTIVPVSDKGEKTTERGWEIGENEKNLKDTISLLSSKVRLVLFVEPEEGIVKYAANLGFNGVEFHTKRYASLFNTENKQDEINIIKKMASLARKLNMYVNLGHDLSLENLYDVVMSVMPDEISVGHRLIEESLASGLDPIIGMYKKILKYR